MEDPGGVAVSGAEIFASSDEPWVVRGATNEHGDVTLDAGEAQALVVKHPRFQTVEHRLAPEELRARSVRATLPHGGAIEGIVNGAGDYGALTVVATPRPGRDLKTIHALLRARHPAVATSPVSADGRFDLRGLDMRRTYHVVAMADSILGSSEPPWLEPGPPDAPAWAQLQTRSLWMCRLVFTGPAGAPIHVAPNLSHSMSSPGRVRLLEPPPAELEEPDGADGVALYALSPPEADGMRDGRFVVTRFLVGPATVEVPIPVEIPIEIELPGYAPYVARASFAALPAEPSPQVHELEPAAQGWGSVEVRVVGGEYLSEIPVSDWKVRQYHIQLEGEGRRLLFEYPNVLPSRVRIADVPYGRYVASLRSPGTLVRVPMTPAELTVGPETATADLDVAAFGSLRITVLDHGDEWSENHVGVSVIHGDGPRTGHQERFLVTGPPYVISHLSVGTYYLWLDVPYSAKFVDPSASTPNTVLVTESSITEAVFSR